VALYALPTCAFGSALVVIDSGIGFGSGALLPPEFEQPLSSSNDTSAAGANAMQARHVAVKLRLEIFPISLEGASGVHGAPLLGVSYSPLS
jgi:hypothetical protein